MKVARLSNDGTLILKGELIEREALPPVLYFNGASRAVTIDNTDNRLQPSDTFTWEMWFKLDGYTQYNTLMGFGGNNLDFGRMDSTMRFRCHTYDINNSQRFINPSGFNPVDDGQWHHMAIVWDGVNGESWGFIDGVQRHYATMPIESEIRDTSSLTTFTIGGATPTGRLIKGWIKDVRMWNVARTQEEILANMSSKLIGDEEGLLLYLPLDEGKGETVVDKASGFEANINSAIWEGDAKSIGLDTGGNINLFGEFVEIEDKNYLSFDGVDDYMEIPNSAENLSFTDNFTISAWKYFYGEGGNYQDPIISKAHRSWGSQQYDFTFNGGFHSIRNDSYRIYCIFSLGNINNGRFHNSVSFYIPIESFPCWLHYTGVYEKVGTTHKTHTYVHDKSGNLIAQSTQEIPNSEWGGITTGHYDVNISRSPRSGGEAYGGIKEVKIWNKVLTQQEIEDNLFKELIGDEVGLKAYWSLDEGEGGIVIDRANNGFDGVIHGATWEKEVLDFKFRLSNNKILVSELIEGGV